jgi:hypothetical protein
MKAPKYVKSHMSSKHRDIPKAEHPDPVEVLHLDAVPDPVEDSVAETPAVEPSSPVKSLEDLAASRATVPEATAPPVSMPPSAMPPTPPPAPTEVAVGSVIELQGPQWKMDPITNRWAGYTADGVQVDVFAKAPGSDGAIMLSCRTVNGTDLWSVPETAVLDGTLSLIKDSGSTELPPDPVELAEMKAMAEEFKARAALYVAARDAFSAQEKAFNAVKEEHREFLMQYIKKNGVQDDSSLSTLLEDLGYYSQVVVSQGATRKVYKEQAIVDMLMTAGLDNYLSAPGFDAEKWEMVKTLKAADGQPVVSESFIASVETEETPDARESLCIKVQK